MIVESRNPDLKSPPEIKKEKIKIVLDWLLEFRFSSIEILSSRIGQSKINANRFFNSLIEDGIIRKFKNVHTGNVSYVMLTSIGKSYLEAYGRDISNAVTRQQSLGKYSQIVHHIAVQALILKYLGDYSEVIWDRNIRFEGECIDRPDALLLSHGGFWVAFEYERWRKEKKRIYLSFFNHASSLIKSRYSAVFYSFESAGDRDFYRKLFEAEEWPRIKKDLKSGKYKSTSRVFIPDDVKHLRDCFRFM